MSHFFDLDASVMPAPNQNPVADEATQKRELGAKLRQLRGSAGMTMSHLAQAADVSPSLISQIERGHAEPSLATLRRIVRILDVPISTVFVSGGTDGEHVGDRHGSTVVVRRENRKVLLEPGSAISHQLLVPELGRNLEVVYTQIPPHARNPAHPASHEGEETTIVIAGRLVAIHDGVEFSLDWGDTITWDPSKPHWVENRTDAPATVIGISTPHLSDGPA